MKYDPEIELVLYIPRRIKSILSNQHFDTSVYTALVIVAQRGKQVNVYPFTSWLKR